MLNVFRKWAPSSDVTFHQFLAYVDGSGGASVIESDNMVNVAHDIAPFTPYCDYRVTPVIDAVDMIPLIQQGIEFRASIS
jgi:hypothetical protein